MEVYRSNSSSKSIMLCLPKDMRIMIVMKGMGMIRGGARGLVRRCKPALGMNDDDETLADVNFHLSVLRYG